MPPKKKKELTEAEIKAKELAEELEKFDDQDYQEKSAANVKVEDGLSTSLICSKKSLNGSCFDTRRNFKKH